MKTVFGVAKREIVSLGNKYQRAEKLAESFCWELSENWHDRKTEYKIINTILISSAESCSTSSVYRHEVRMQINIQKKKTQKPINILCHSKAWQNWSIVKAIVCVCVCVWGGIMSIGDNEPQQSKHQLYRDSEIAQMPPAVCGIKASHGIIFVFLSITLRHWARRIEPPSARRTYVSNRQAAAWTRILNTRTKQ